MSEWETTPKSVGSGWGPTGFNFATFGSAEYWKNLKVLHHNPYFLRRRRRISDEKLFWDTSGEKQVANSFAFLALLDIEAEIERDELQHQSL